MERKNDRINLNIQKGAWVLSILLFCIKSIAYQVTNSNAILTDALEGLVNIIGAGFGIFSLYYAMLPKDKNHPYGHGKIEFISSGVEGSLIVIAGILMIFKAGKSVVYPEVVDINSLGIALIALSGVGNAVMGWAMEKQGKKSRFYSATRRGKASIE